MAVLRLKMFRVTFPCYSFVCMSHSDFDLAAAARREMLERGFHPDFPREVLAQADALPEAPAPPVNGGVRDLRNLLWSSIDNDTSRDLDQIEFAEDAGDGIRVRVGIADVDSRMAPASLEDGLITADEADVRRVRKARFGGLRIQLDLEGLCGFGEQPDRSRFKDHGDGPILDRPRAAAQLFARQRG